VEVFFAEVNCGGCMESGAGTLFDLQGAACFFGCLMLIGIGVRL